MQLLAFSLQRLAGLQAKVAEGEAIKKYHWWGFVLGWGISLVGACVGVGFECVASMQAAHAAHATLHASRDVSTQVLAAENRCVGSVCRHTICTCNYELLRCRS